MAPLIALKSRSVDFGIWIWVRACEERRPVRGGAGLGGSVTVGKRFWEEGGFGGQNNRQGRADLASEGLKNGTTTGCESSAPQESRTPLPRVKHYATRPAVGVTASGLCPHRLLHMTLKEGIQKSLGC